MSAYEIAKAIDEVVLKVQTASQAVAKAGVFGNAQYNNGVSVGMVANVQEFGLPSKNIPPRSFMRTTVAEQRSKWAKIAESYARNGEVTSTMGVAMMRAIGAIAEGDIKSKIASIQEPPLSPRTVAARARKRADKTITSTLTKPLVDTGLLLSSIHHVVEGE